MTVNRLVDQELAVHVFAPVDGPHAVTAYEQIREIWDRCQRRLGMIQPIPTIGLSPHLPPDLPQAPSQGALAALEDPAADCQAIVRREHDVINFSMVFAAPVNTGSRRLRLGSAAPPGWIEFDRWWTELAAGGTSALLGVVRICQAKCTGPVCAPLDALAQQVRAALPTSDHEPYWWQRGRIGPHGFTVWEISPDDDRGERRLVVLAPEDQDPQLSAWTWSNGEVTMPPLARYLMHAAKLRYHARVRGDGRQIDQIRRRIDDRVTRGMLEARSECPVDSAELRRLRLDQAELMLTATDLQDMQHTVRISIDNMTAALAEPLRTDQALADWLTQQLADDADYLANAQQRAQQIIQLHPHRRLQRPSPTPSEGADPPQDSPRSIQVRMGFGVDAVGYSTRPAPQQEHAQHRLAALVHRVLRELNLRLEQTDHQGTGDGMNVFFPTTVELHRTLPTLIHAWTKHLAADNQQHQDRLRLRLATVVGPLGIAAIGFSGNTIVEIRRLLDSKVLRRALIDHPHADLAVLISDHLHDYVIGEGYPDLDATQLRRHLIEAKEYRKHAWLWTPN